LATSKAKADKCRTAIFNCLLSVGPTAEESQSQQFGSILMIEYGQARRIIAIVLDQSKGQSYQAGELWSSWWKQETRGHTTSKVH